MEERVVIPSATLKQFLHKAPPVGVVMVARIIAELQSDPAAPFVIVRHHYASTPHTDRQWYLSLSLLKATGLFAFTPSRHSTVVTMLDGQIAPDAQESKPKRKAKPVASQAVLERYDKFVAQFNQIKSKTVGRTMRFGREQNAIINFKKFLDEAVYEPRDVLNALQNALKDPYHVANGYGYITPEFMLRSDKLARYVNYTPPNETKTATQEPDLFGRLHARQAAASGQ